MAGVSRTPSAADGAPDCSVAELFSAYLDGELQPGELDRVVAHLDGCLDCIAEFHQIKAVRVAVRSMPQLQVPERLLPATHHGPALSAYLDGELPTRELETLQTHLATCAECRAELHDLDAARTAVRSLPRLEPPESLDVRRVAATERRNSRRRQLVAVAASAAAILAIGTAALRPAEPEPTEVIDSLADRHIARASLEAGFTVVPAAEILGGAP